MAISVKHLAELVHGQVHGDDAMLIRAGRPVDVAANGEITFLENEKHLHLLHGSKASAAVVSSSVPANGMTLIRVADPLAAFVTIVQHLQGRAEFKPHGIDPRASVHASACLGADPSVMPFAVIGEQTVIGARCRVYGGAVIGAHCVLGDDVTIYPNAVLYDGTVLGSRVTVHANAVLGADGFGFRLVNGRHVKVPQLGHVEIGDDVEIGAATTIDRGTFKATRVGRGTKIDNQVQIGHNCDIGCHNLLVSQVGIAGSCSTGDYVVLAGQVGVADHVQIGNRVVVGGQSGIARDIGEGERVLGTPAIAEREQKRVMLSLGKLPELCRDVRRLKQQVGLKDD